MSPELGWAGIVSPGWFVPAILSVPVTVVGAIVEPAWRPWLWVPVILGASAALIYGVVQLQAIRVAPLAWTRVEVWPPWATRFHQHFDTGSPVSVVETSSTVSLGARREWWSCARCERAGTSAATWRDYARLPWLERQLERQLEAGARVVVLANEDDAVVFAHEPARRGGTRGDLWAMTVLWATELFAGAKDTDRAAADAPGVALGRVSAGTVEHAARAFTRPSRWARQAAFSDLAREHSTPPSGSDGMTPQGFSELGAGSNALWRSASGTVASAAGGLVRIATITSAPMVIVAALVGVAARFGPRSWGPLTPGALLVIIDVGVAFALVSALRLIVLFRRGAPVEMSGASLKRPHVQRASFELERSALWERRWSLRALWWIAHAGEGVLDTGERISVRSVRASPWLSRSATSTLIQVAMASPRMAARVTETEVQTVPEQQLPGRWEALAELQHFLFQKGGGTVLVMPTELQISLPRLSENPGAWGGLSCDVAEAIRFAREFATALQSFEGSDPGPRGYRDGPLAPAPEQIAWLTEIAGAQHRGFPAPADGAPPKDDA